MSRWREMRLMHVTFYGVVAFEEELENLLGLGADDAIEEHGSKDMHLAARVLRTCVRMTSSGSAYGRFRRALDNGNSSQPEPWLN